MVIGADPSKPEVPMTLTPEQKEAISQSGNKPVRLEDPETHTAYLIVREEDYRQLFTQAAIDHTDRSLYEVGEFCPKR